MKWIDTKVGEYCPFVYGKGLPKTQRKKGTIPVYGSNGCVDFHTESYVKGPGIIIGRKGSVGAVHLSENPFWPIDTSFYVKKASIDELKFTFHLLKSLGLEGMNSDSAVPGLNRENAHALYIQIPENKEDREKLGKWIYVYDEKIELNRQTNQTLEQMAHAIFKSWFVDFEPTRAKIAAKLNGQDPERAAMASISGKTIAELDQLSPATQKQLRITASLFPEKLVDSELGAIPERWEVANMKSFCKITDFVANGSFASLKDNVTYCNEGFAILIRLTDFNNGWAGELRYVDENAYNFLNKSSLSVGDIVISNVGANAGTVFRVPDLGKPMTLGPNSIVIKSTICRLYLFYHFTSHFGQYQLDGIKGGSAQPKFNKTDFRSLNILKPTDDVLEVFNQHICGIELKCFSNDKNTQKLVELRDTLRPKLLSGELIVGKD
jgi:type I restriction enzyme S subunit